jgi:hypothetical protein
MKEISMKRVAGSVAIGMLAALTTMPAFAQQVSRFTAP